MDQHTHPFIGRIRSLAYPEVICECIDQSPGKMPVPGVDDHPCRLVEHQKVVVFIYYVERNVLRQYFKASSLVWHDECHHISRTDDAVCLCDLVVDPYIVLLDGALDAVA